jgi:hypothetical protein
MYVYRRFYAYTYMKSENGHFHICEERIGEEGNGPLDRCIPLHLILKVQCPIFANSYMQTR